MSDMLARTWMLAARFREPSDYGIPEAPVFPAERCDSGALRLHDPDSGQLVMVAGAPMQVRR
jgi:hypothetical protein